MAPPGEGKKTSPLQSARVLTVMAAVAWTQAAEKTYPYNRDVFSVEEV